MKKLSLVFLALGILPSLWAQQHEEAAPDTSWKKLYRESAPRINDLVHTKLDVKFDYSKSQMNGLAWITLAPHFYPTARCQRHGY
jgi:aminopeptidase N